MFRSGEVILPLPDGRGSDYSPLPDERASGLPLPIAGGPATRVAACVPAGRRDLRPARRRPLPKARLGHCRFGRVTAKMPLGNRRQYQTCISEASP